MIKNDKEMFCAIRFIENIRLDYPDDEELQAVADLVFLDAVLYDKLTSEGRIGEWTIIASGKRFWLLDPRPEDICIEDIAYSLARIARFNGQQLGVAQYSVGEHCLRGSFEIDPKYALAFLLHDASEYVTGDLISPLKKIPEIRTPYKKIEEKIEHIIFDKFGVVFDRQTQEAVKRTDNLMLAQEMRDFTLYRKGFGCSGYQRLKNKIVPFSPLSTEALYLARFYELYGKIQESVH